MCGYGIIKLLAQLMDVVMVSSDLDLKYFEANWFCT